MKAVVLLSAGLHPVSARPAPVPVEMQAIALARTLGAAAAGLHAGPGGPGVADALGHGLARIGHLPLARGADPLEALVNHLAAHPPELVLAGRCGQGGEDSGLLPYALAARLGWPLIADAVALEMQGPGVLAVRQALERGGRRTITVRLPAVVTVHPAAPAAAAFAWGQARRGVLEVLPVPSGFAGDAVPAPELRPYRPRPRLIRGAASGGSAADRLKAATESAAADGKLMVGPSPEEAAREILAHLRKLGLVPPRQPR
ncbi:electron transfer flavoprotein subunit beta [Radicibacter daui]|uniref:electron transfer flavoprotein subunit beta n=1 Tax=Radicibacter daui TaxID=3064829 RepID=UPI004046D928